MAATSDMDLARAMPAIRTAFESLKEMLGEGRMQAASRQLHGRALQWGAELKTIYRADGRERLEQRDPLTRFFVLRLRGMPEPGDLTSAPDAAAFLMAFTSFSYLDALMDETSLGEHQGVDENGNILVGRVLAGDPDGNLTAASAGAGWQFDLMPLYQAKAEALEGFITAEYAGSFSAFFERYLGEHDIAFDLERAWAPLAGGVPCG